MTFDEWLGLSKLPKIEARMLLQYVSEYTRVQLLTRGGEEMPDEVRQRADRLAQRRLNGEPVAYILGVREFYGRRFTVNPSVLIPRPETEHLVEAVLARLPENGRVWDLGTGSGAVAVTVALERPDAFVRASDISTPALETARKNAADLGARVEFAHGSWFDTDMPSEGKWDIIVSNPPYIENGDKHLLQGDLRFEPQIALTDFSDGLSCIRTLAQGAPDRLAEGGFLLLEHGFVQGAAVRGVLAENGFSGVETLPDLAGLDRVTLGKYMKHLK
ncbi:TPA: peptide chain release factor N(5)-glutamine methyltransferase [Neisseria meningitidis]